MTPNTDTRPKGSPFLGMLCVTGAALIFGTSDMLLKTLTGDYPLHQVVLFRATFAMIVTLVLFVPLEGGYSGLKTKKLPLHLIRGSCVVIANMSFFFGLAAMPLAEATAIFFFAPLAITALSVPLLGETVGPRRWAAVLVGMIGVLIVVRPGTDAFQIAAIGPLVAALAYASMQILSRKLGATEKASTMAFYIQITFVVVCVTSGLFIGDGRFSEGLDNPSLLFLLRGWVVPPLEDALLMASIGCISAFGAYLISQGYRISEATAVAPFEYATLPASVVWGILVFNDYPDAYTIAGITLIMGGGLYAFWRETVRGRHIATARPMPRNSR